jgi:octaprenyl-diphosphate synthase
VIRRRQPDLGPDVLGRDLKERLDRLDQSLRDLAGGSGIPADFDADRFLAPGIPRVRPLLVLLSERAVLAHGEAEGEQMSPADHDAAEHMAMAAEMLHVAIGVHDRALGLPGGRRRRAARKLLGAVGWLGANHLTLRALELARHAPTPEVVDDVLDALREIADGHALSESINGRPATAAECEELAEGYTGAVFDFACRSGARVAGGKPQVVRSLGRYGRHTGVAWHMRDDLEAMTAHPDDLASTIESQLSKRSPNFAVSLGAERDPIIGSMWMRLRKSPDDDLARELGERVVASGALSAGRERLMSQTWRARKALSGLSPSPHRDALDKLAATIAK